MNDSTPSKNPNNLQPKQLVKFATEGDPGDLACRFIVLELRGPRVLVADASFVRVNDFQIAPTFVYPTVDLIAAE